MKRGRAQPATLVCAAMRAIRRPLQLMLVIGAIAVSAPAIADGADESEVYRLSPGDRIFLTVFGQPDLSGELTIDGRGNVVVPLLGSISVGDLTMIECQQAVIDRLADGVLDKPVVQVRLAEPRPLYILGDVRTPGAYPFRYGSTVKRALATAGGYRRAESDTAIYDFLVADERIRVLNSQRLGLLMRRERLEAQRDGAKTFSPTTLQPQGSNRSSSGALEVDQSKYLEETAAIEKEIFDSEGKTLAARLEILSSQRPRLEGEIEAVNGQTETAKKELEIIQQQEESYNALVKKGLGRTDAEVQLKLAESSHQTDIWRLAAEVNRLRMDSVDLDIKIQEADSAFRKQVLSELEDVRQRLNDVEVALASAREIREARLHQTNISVAGDEPHSFAVTRSRGGKTTIFQATGDMTLEPGDILEVKSLLAKEAGQPVVSNAADELTKANESLSELQFSDH
jgi:polysaccharide biosynthesis/export protein